MIYLQDDIGLIPYMRNCLKGATYGETKTRVTLAADIETYLNAQSKLTVPAWVVTPGATITEELGEPGGTLVRQHMIEQVDIFLVLDASKDKVGRIPVDQIHAARLDILGCLLGFNAFIQADCFSEAYGYTTKEMRNVGDDWYSHDPARYVHEFNFALWSEINTCEQGVGATFPEAVQPLNKILLDIEPSEVTLSEQPAIEAEIPRPPPPP